MTQTLYSWGQRLVIAPFLDHTWTTSYPMTETAPPDGDYWYCWGDKHDSIRAKLSETAGDLALAGQIMPANTPALPKGSPQGTASDKSGAVVYYALDGVCHQTANEVLAATATKTTEPARVSASSGYALSTFFYGTYGLNPGWGDYESGILNGLKLPGDDFLPLMRAAVPEAQQNYVITLRQTVHLALAGIRTRVEDTWFDYYEEIGALNVSSLILLHNHLGAETYHKLFPSLDFSKGDHENTGWLRPPTQS